MPSRRRAFTLVELLVVIGIIVVLMAMMLPIITRVRGSAINQVCKNNLRQIGAGILMYVNNNKGRFADPVTLGGAACRRLVGETDPDVPGSLPETYGWSALLDEGGYLKAERATGGSWVCPAQRERFQAYKNTYLAWTVPKGPGQDKKRNHYLLVWENAADLAWPTGLPAPVSMMRARPDDDYVHYAFAGSLPNPVRQWGPHQYRLAVPGHPEPGPQSGIPNGTVFFPNGFSHAMRTDMSLATFQHFKVIVGADFEATMTWVQVE